MGDAPVVRLWFRPSRWELAWVTESVRVFVFFDDPGDYVTHVEYEKRVSGP